VVAIGTTIVVSVISAVIFSQVQAYLAVAKKD
jgi:hypothetical protein